MDVFTALAQPKRRQILEILAKEGKVSASEIANAFQISAPAVSQHLNVLKKAKLVKVEKRAQKRLYHINPDKFEDLEIWAQEMRQRHEKQFKRLDVVLKAKQSKKTEKPQAI